MRTCYATPVTMSFILYSLSTIVITRAITDEMRRCNSALYFAASTGNTTEVGNLLAHRANVNATGGTSAADTPLFCAAAHGYVDVAKQLLAAKARVNLKDTDGDTPLHLAAMTSDTLVTALIEAKANVGASNGRGESALHEAAGMGNKGAGVTKVLLLAKAPVNQQDMNGNTPLHVAATNGATAVAKLLIEHRADVRARNKRHKTPFEVAMERRKSAVSQMLMAAHQSDMPSVLWGVAGVCFTLACVAVYR